MRKPRSTANLLFLLLITSLPGLWLAYRFMLPAEAPSGQAVQFKVQLGGGKERIDLTQNADGTFSYVIDAGRASQEVLTPNELAELLYRQEVTRNWVTRLLNISSPIGFIWVAVGLLGQLLFTGRMLVQWLASEKSRQSVIPPVFWWLSLVGALMLLTYFIWRRDIVGVLGQSFGLIIYVRNLYFIYGDAGALPGAPAEADAAPAPAATLESLRG